MVIDPYPDGEQAQLQKFLLVGAHKEGSIHRPCHSYCDGKQHNKEKQEAKRPYPYHKGKAKEAFEVVAAVPLLIDLEAPANAPDGIPQADEQMHPNRPYRVLIGGDMGEDGKEDQMRQEVGKGNLVGQFSIY